MAQGTPQKGRSTGQEEEMGEERFLKELYMFMKQRDTPIERIPHLGFKQIDLYVMYKTVKDLGGYHQVTGQQLWKKVYNILGGNPRSTSAATCTRRHYEKLLMAFEFHLTGYADDMAITPPRQHKRFRYSYLDNEDECPRNAKRTDYRHMHSFNQGSHDFLSDNHLRIIPMPGNIRQYFHPGHPSLPNYFPLTPPILPPHAHPVSQTQPQPHDQASTPYLPSSPGVMNRHKQPLERLRDLAKEYKSSAGWAEPLNLSRKGSSLETASHAPSSFTPPPTSNKAPKFLNKASPLYPSRSMAKEEGAEMSDGEAPSPTQAVVCPLVAGEVHVIDLTSCSPTIPSVKTESSNPLPPPCRRASDPCALPPKPPERGFHPAWAREGPTGAPQPCPGPLNLSQVLYRPPPEQAGRMEIQIPLALLQDWIKGGLLLSPASSQPGPGHLKPSAGLTLPSQARVRERTSSEASDNSIGDNNPADLSFYNHLAEQQRSSMVDLDQREGIFKRYRNLARLTTTNEHQLPPNHHYASGKPFIMTGGLKSSSSSDAYAWRSVLGRKDTKRPSHLIPGHTQNQWDKETNQAQPTTLGNQDSVGPKSPGYSSDTSQSRSPPGRLMPAMGPLGRLEKSLASHPAVLMVSPSSPSMLHLTPEECLKLKKLISSSP